jgi:hypothetical protein
MKIESKGEILESYKNREGYLDQSIIESNDVSDCIEKALELFKCRATIQLLSDVHGGKHIKLDYFNSKVIKSTY